MEGLYPAKLVYEAISIKLYMLEALSALHDERGKEISTVKVKDV
jgi:hypothetical protein